MFRDCNNKVLTGEHQTEEEVQGFHDDDVLSIEDRSLSRPLENVSIGDHDKSPRQRDTRSSDGNEPIGKH